MTTTIVSKGTYFNSEVLRSTFAVDDKLTFATHGDKIDGDEPTNCVYGKTLVCICISIYSTFIEKYEVVNLNGKWLQCSSYTCTSHIASSITTC